MQITIPLFAFFTVFITSGFVTAAELPAADERRQTPVATSPFDSECPPVRCPPSPEAIYEKRIKERARRRHDAELKRLQRVMRREGPIFSPEKFRRYRIQQASGLALLIVGGAGAVTSAFLLAAGLVRGFDTDPETGSFNDPDSTHALYTAGFALLAAATVTLSAGVPLFILGRKGIKRQRVLQRKEEIQQFFSLGFEFRLQEDRKRNFLGLSIGTRF